MGYGRYAAMHALSRVDRVPKALRRMSAAALAKLPLRGAMSSRASHLATLLRSADQPRQDRYSFTITAFADQHKVGGYGEAMRDCLDQSALDLFAPFLNEAESLVSGANWADIHVYLPDDLMVKVDIATMAYSLESRSPLLDHVLLEWAMTLPEDATIPGGTTKAIFKKAMEPFLPHDVIYRRKMGFGCPVDHWLRGELKEMAYDLLLSPLAQSRGIMDRNAVQVLLDEHCSGSNEHHTRLWPLLIMELWFRMWIDHNGAAQKES